MLQCVAVWCSVVQCGTVCCSMLQYVAVCYSVLQCVVVCCSVLQCVEVCCNRGYQCQRQGVVDEKGSEYILAHTGPIELDDAPWGGV